MRQPTDSSVFLRGVRIFAFHGVLEQERKVGGWFMVDLRVHYNIMKASQTDCVNDTLNYAHLLNIVNTEMSQPSHLLEHVAGRIAQRLFKTYPEATAIDIIITKENPPMGAHIGGAGIELHLINDKSIG